MVSLNRQFLQKGRQRLQGGVSEMGRKEGEKGRGREREREQKCVKQIKHPSTCAMAVLVEKRGKKRREVVVEEEEE